jgi:tetratricopeptide (TPR) repeat protein
VEKALADLEGERKRYRRLRPIIDRQATLAARHCDLLLNFPPEQQIPKILNSKSRYRTRPMVLELLKRCGKRIRRDPKEAYRLAELAEHVARRILGLHEYAGGLRAVADLQALSLAHQGNALRAQCRWEEAEGRFQRAAGLLTAKNSEVCIRAEVLSLHASLLKDRRSYAQALEALQQAELLARGLEDRSLQGKLLLNRATIFQELLQTAQAIQALEACTKLLDGKADRRLLAVAYHNLA